MVNNENKKFRRMLENKRKFFTKHSDITPKVAIVKPKIDSNYISGTVELYEGISRDTILGFKRKTK